MSQVNIHRAARCCFHHWSLWCLLSKVLWQTSGTFTYLYVYTQVDSVDESCDFWRPLVLLSHFHNPKLFCVSLSHKTNKIHLIVVVTWQRSWRGTWRLIEDSVSVGDRSSRGVISDVTVMFCAQGSLSDYLKTNVLSWSELCIIAQSMCNGLAFLHEDIPGRKPAVAHRYTHSHTQGYNAHAGIWWEHRLRISQTSQLLTYCHQNPFKNWRCSFRQEVPLCFFFPGPYLLLFF